MHKSRCRVRAGQSRGLQGPQRTDQHRAYAAAGVRRRRESRRARSRSRARHEDSLVVRVAGIDGARHRYPSRVRHLIVPLCSGVSADAAPTRFPLAGSTRTQAQWLRCCAQPSTRLSAVSMGRRLSTVVEGELSRIETRAGLCLTDQEDHILFCSPRGGKGSSTQPTRFRGVPDRHQVPLTPAEAPAATSPPRPAAPARPGHHDDSGPRPGGRRVCAGIPVTSHKQKAPPATGRGSDLRNWLW